MISSCRATNILLSAGRALDFQNDADGNTLSTALAPGGGRTSAWDSQNRLVSGTVVK